MFIVTVAKCLTEAAEELILFMVLEDSGHHGGRGNGAGLSGTALFVPESKQTECKGSTGFLFCLFLLCLGSQLVRVGPTHI